ncbi:uncharacterized protein LOC130987065 [Salvia miltiorrhiza]|nr:uncharacterized protein LOC130987065 [Salvia miltiorrhiza]
MNEDTAPTPTSTDPASTGPAPTLHSTTHANASTSTIMKERNTALKGLGVYVAQGTGNIYVNMSSRSARGTFVPPRPNTRSTTSGSQASGVGSSNTQSAPTAPTGSAPTQESQGT